MECNVFLQTALAVTLQMFGVFLFKCSTQVFLLFCFLQVGDIVTVTAMNISGQWEGELGEKKGDFPFHYVEFIDEDSEQEES